MEPNSVSNSENLSANTQHLLDRFKEFESRITLSTGRLFGLYAQNEHQQRALELLIREELREIKQDLVELKEKVKQNGDAKGDQPV